ncbi:MAG TPA: response regulator [Anaerolineae bacterium]
MTDEHGHEKKTILIVDDNPANLTVLRSQLEVAGFNIILLADGKSAVKQVGEIQPDIILLDILMPKPDGFETCRQLKALNSAKDIPIIFLTALAQTEDKVKAFEAGAVDYITKPLRHEEVIARVSTHLSMRQLQQDLKEQNNRLQEENIRRKRVQDALQESRTRYRLLAEYSTDMIARQTPQGIYRYVSPACRTLLGYEIEEIIGKSAYDFFHPDDLSVIRAAEAELSERPPVSTITYRARRKDDSYVWVETTNRIVRDPKTGVELEITSVSRNVTERKEAKERLQKAHDELEQRVAERTAEIKAYSEELKEKNETLSRLDKLKDEFLANTSHELRTPLNGIISIAESLIDGAAGSLTPKQIYNLSLVVSSGRRLANLVNDILDFSKLKHHELDLRLRPIDMRAITEVLLTLSQAFVGPKSLELVNLIDPDLPPANADEARVQQILHNLIGNAIKFTEAGTVTVSAEVQDNLLAITVSDTGIGIPEDKLESIFQSFEQVDASATRAYGGTGLGLSITRELVKLHGGTIQVESTSDEGSHFTFTLPIYRGMAGVDGMNGKTQSDETVSSTTRSLIEPMLMAPLQELAENKNFTILIVDDEMVNVQVLTNYLSLQNYGVAQAFDGSEALEAVEELELDLILLDIMMPKMSGYEVCRKIRERYPANELPIVLLTAKNQSSDMVAGFEAGANDYLTKPIDKNELLARVKTHLRLAKINAAYGRFVPHEILRFLNKESIVDVNLGDQVQKEMAILCCDIRSFTSLSEQMSPQETFNFLNSYLSRVSPIIRQHNGFIDKYIGDAVMALFPEQTEDALQAAIGMREEVGRYNESRLKEGQRPIEIGIGLHTGTLMLGTLGEDKRMEGTVIADAVNLAFRLEGITKLYGAPIVVSGPALFSIERPTNYHFRFLDKVQVKGKEEPVSVFEIFNGDSQEIIDLKLKTLTNFERALLHYHSKEFQEALNYFEEVLKHNSGDKAAQIYKKRTEQYIKFGVPIDWQGIASLTEK